MPSAARGHGRGRGALWWLLVPVLLGGGLRLVAMQQTFPTRPIGDELYYLGTAVNIAQGRGHFYNRWEHAYRPPAFSFLLSRLIDVDRRGGRVGSGKIGGRLDRLDPANPDPWLRDFLRPLVGLQVLLGTILVALTATLGRTLFDTRTGLVAGCVAAVYPPFIAFSHYLWSDAFFAVLITAALIGVVYGGERRSWWMAAVTGAVFGAAALTRQLAIPIAGICALWWLAIASPDDRWSTVRRGALVLGVAALVVLPWTYRNYLRFDRFVPVATVGSLAMAGGNTLESPDWMQPHGPALDAFNNRYFAIHDEMGRVDFSRRWTRARIREEQPTWIFKKAVRVLPQLLSPDSIVFYKIHRGAYGDVPTMTRRSIVASTALAYVLVIVAGVLGIAGTLGRGRKLLPGLLFGFVILVHIITMANARHRLPWMPLLIVYASFAVVHFRALSWRSTRRGLVIPIVVLLVFFGLCVPQIGPIASELWSSPAGDLRPW